ncbi:hypothetical protein Vretifemale_8793, partial [Volvox reticuliferus]
MVVLAVQDARWLHGTGKFPGGCVEIKPSATDYMFVLEAAWERCWEKHRTELSTVQQDARWLHGTGKFPGGCVEIKQAWWCWPYRMLDGFTALGSFPAAVWRSNR